MRFIGLLFVVLLAASSGLGDSRAWPPSPSACSNRDRTRIFIFDPVMKNKEVVGTVVMYFEWTDRYPHLACTLKRTMNVWVEPHYAFMAKKHGHVVILSESRVNQPDYAIALLDTNRGTIVWSRTLDDLFPSRKKDYSPDWSGSTSTTAWIESAEVDPDGNLLRIVTKKPEENGIQESGLFEHASTISVDLETFKISVSTL